VINFFYKYGLLSIFSFVFSNLLFFIFENFFQPSLASFITIVIVFNINVLLFFKTRLFTKSKKNYYKLLIISISFRIFEYLLFNILYFFIFTNLKSNYIFIISLIISYFIKTVVYYKSSINDNEAK